MASASSSEIGNSIRKMRLRNTPMFVTRLRGGKEQRFVSVLFTFSNFSRLEKNCPYSKLDRDKRWTVLLTKSEEDVNIKFMTGFDKTFQVIPKCYVSHRKHRYYRECGHLVEVEEGVNRVYQITIPSECLRSPEFLWEDKVLVQIRFNPDRRRNLAVIPLCDGLVDTCIERLSADLSSEEALNWHNFMIFTNEQMCLAPKGLCASRSSVIRDYLANRGGAMGFEVPVKKLTPAVVLFMISGKFLVPDDTQSVVDLMNLADIMGIPSLKSLCSVVFQDDLNIIYD